MARAIHHDETDAESNICESLFSASTDSLSLHNRKLRLETCLPSLQKAYLITSDKYRLLLDETMRFLLEKSKQINSTDKENLRKSVLVLNNITTVLTSSLKTLRTALKKHSRVITKVMEDGGLTRTKITTSQLSLMVRSPVRSQTLSDVDESLDDESFKSRQNKMDNSETHCIVISDDESHTDVQQGVVVISDDEDDQLTPNLLNKCTTKRKSDNVRDEHEFFYKKLRDLKPNFTEKNKSDEVPVTTNPSSSTSIGNENNEKRLSLIKESASGSREHSSSITEHELSTSSTSPKPVASPLSSTSPKPVTSPSSTTSPRTLISLDPFRRPMSFAKARSPRHYAFPPFSHYSNPFSPISTPESPTYFRRPSPRRNTTSPYSSNPFSPSTHNLMPNNSPGYLSSPVPSPFHTTQSHSSSMESLPTVDQLNQTDDTHPLPNGPFNKHDEKRSKLDHVQNWLENLGSIKSESEEN